MHDDNSTTERLRSLEAAVLARPDDRGRLIELGRMQHQSRAFQAAVRSFRAALELAEDGLAWNELGRSLNNLRDFTGAEQAFGRAIELDADFAQAHNNLGHVRRARGELGGAERSFRAAIEADPRLTSAHHNLATVLCQTGCLEAAVAAFEAGLDLQPDDPQALVNLADTLRLCERYDEAETSYRRAVALDPSCVDAWAALGSMLLSRRRPEAAEEALGEALRRMPGHSLALTGMAALKELQGDYVGGEQLLEPLIRSGRATPDLQVAYGRILRRLDRGDEALALVESVIDSVSDTRHVPPIVYFTLGDLYDATGAYDKAFAAYRTANDRQSNQFDHVGHERAVDALIRFFDSEQLSRLNRASVRRQVPIFIVGMPRSGTSLVEQILGSHQQVHPGGERGDMLEIAAGIQSHLGGRRRYPRCLTGATRRDLDVIAERYFDTLGILDGGVTHVTDKMPANFLTLGLIAILCPNACIVHCRRQPLDMALSCFFQNFNSEGLAFTREFEHIAIYYQQYLRLMTHWRAVLDLPVLDLDYESLVTDVETWSRRLIEFVGLDWDPDCLAFHRLDRTINTASHAQVRRPIYTTSVDRHQHYAEYLAPLKTALGIA